MLSLFVTPARASGYEHYGLDQGLATGEVVSIAEDLDGYLWVATFASGVHRFNGQVFERFGQSQGLSSQRVKRIHVDRAGRVRIATLAGLFLFERERFVQDPRLGAAAIYDLLEARDGSLWCATGDGAVRLRGNEVLRLGVKEGLPMANATALAEGTNGEIWIGTIRGLVRFAAGRMDVWRGTEHGFRDYVTRLLVGRQGELWIASDRGVVHFDGTRFRKLDLGVGGRELYVLDLVFDWKGRMRIATLGAGVLSWDGERIMQSGIDQGLPSSNVWSLAARQAGGLWIGTEEHGLFLREAGPFEPVISAERLSNAVPADLALAADGGLWVATIGAGAMHIKRSGTILLSQRSAQPIRQLTYAEGLPSDFVRRLLPSRSGLWVGTKVGLAFWDDRAVTVLDARREPFPVRGLIEEPDGRIWLVNKEEGLVRYTQRGASGLGGGRRAWQAERFPFDKEPTPASLWSIARSPRDPEGPLWLGATSALYRFDGQSFQRWEAQGLASTDRLGQLIFDAEDRLWFRSDEAVGFVDLRGAAPTWVVLSVPRASWLAVTERGEVLTASEDGLYRLRAGPGTAVEVIGLVSPAEGYPRSAADASGVLKEADGSLLFGTSEGIFRYDPTQAHGPAPARIHLRRVRLLDDVVPVPDAEHPLRLRHRQNFVAVDFDATAFPAPNMIEFRYRLEGLSERWSPPTIGRTAIFPNLPPGRFFLRVQARHGGAWDSEAVSGPIQVLPAYWQTGWFRTLLAALVLLVSLAVPVLRVWRLQRQREQLERLVAARTTELARYSGQLESLVAARTNELEQTYRTMLAREEERNRVAEALAKAHSQASLGRLAGVVAHQVNTPLAAMKTRLALLHDDPHIGPGADSSLRVIGRQVDRIARIVRVLLGFVRQRELGGDRAPINPLVQSVVDLYAEAMRARGVTLAVVLPAEPLVARGSSEDLQELVLILVENAREAVEPGGHVLITVECRDGKLRLLVEDDGCGLGDDPERAFAPFFTTKTTGTGLGLVIARRVAEAAGGTLTAENRFPDGRGARFVLTLPLIRPDPD